MTSPAAPAPGQPRPPRVVIVDDHGLFRSGVRSELGDQVEVIGEADDVQPAIALISACLPDVVLLDVHLPGGGGQAVVTADARARCMSLREGRSALRTARARREKQRRSAG